MEEISDKINEKYSNKVIQNIGLCVAMYDLLTASDGLISHETGNVNVKGNTSFFLLISYSTITMLFLYVSYRSS